MNKNIIKKARPEASEKTIEIHLGNVSRVLNLLHTDDIDKLKNIKKVMEALKSKSFNTQKSYISSIYVFLDAMDAPEAQEYKTKLDEMLKKMNIYTNQQVKSEKQSDNWVDWSELVKVMEDYGSLFMNRNLYKKKKLDKDEFDLLEKWLITSLYCSGNPPRRLEYRDMKIVTNSEYNNLSDKEKEENNYLVGMKKFSFGDYKTKNKFGIQIIKVNPYLEKVLKYFIKYKTNKNILFDIPNDKFSRLVSDAFSPLDKNITVNMIRHIYITDKYPANTKEREKLAEEMGHSLQTNINYSLRD